MLTSRVLIVEDDPASQDILEQLLNYHQIGADVAGTAEEALDYLATKAYALAIIDLALPGMDGWELLDALQSSPRTSTLRSVAITAYYDPGLAKQARIAGFQACFPKPATQDLVQRLRSMIDNPQ